MGALFLRAPLLEGLFVQSKHHFGGSPEKGGVPFFCGIVFRFWLFGFLAFWLLGFLASWLLGFLVSASRLLGFSASCWFMRLCFLALAFRILCIASSSSAGGVLPFAAFRWFMRLLLSQFLSWRFGFCTLSLVFWIWLPASSASPVFSPFESSLLRTSWGGFPPRTCYFLDCLQR